MLPEYHTVNEVSTVSSGSASAASPAVDKQPIPTGIRGFAKTPPRFLDPRGVTNSFTHAKTACFLAMADLVSWLPKGLGSVGITWGKLKALTGFEKRACQAATAELEAEDGIITSSAFPAGRKWAIKQTPIGDIGSVVQSHCANCNEVGPCAVDQAFIPMPHVFFEKVVPALEYGELRLVMAMARHMFKRDDAQIVIVPQERAVAEWAKMADLADSEAEKDLANLQRKGVIASEGVRGRIKVWRLCVENWSTLQPRGKRIGGNPTPLKRGRRKKGEGIAAPTPVQNTEKPKTATPVQFINNHTGTCFKCGWWGPVDLVELREAVPKRPIERARAGPVRQRISKTEESWGVVKRWGG